MAPEVHTTTLPTLRQDQFGSAARYLYMSASELGLCANEWPEQIHCSVTGITLYLMRSIRGGRMYKSRPTADYAWKVVRVYAA